jgi:hypothetical protein
MFSFPQIRLVDRLQLLRDDQLIPTDHISAEGDPPQNTTKYRSKSRSQAKSATPPKAALVAVEMSDLENALGHLVSKLLG